MAARIAFVFLGAILIFQFLMMDATVIRRDVSEAPKQNAGQTLDEALNSFRSSLDDLVKNIQGNELYQNISHSLKQFGEQVQNQSQHLVQKIQAASKTN